MAYGGWQTKQEPITKVNVTPIIDVALVLVIILLVTAPMLSVADLPVNLPQAQTREAEDERNVSITVAQDGALAVDNERVAPEALTDALMRHLAQPGNHDALVVIRADSDIPYGHLRQVLDQARAAGAARLAIATKQKTGAQP
jgi:biopolymer transport protein TolR